MTEVVTPHIPIPIASLPRAVWAGKRSKAGFQGLFVSSKGEALLAVGREQSPSRGDSLLGRKITAQDEA